MSFTIVTVVVAALGLVLSIYNTIQARRDKRPRLRVHVSFGFFAFGSQLGDQKIVFNVGNPWHQTITLVRMCIPLTGKGSLAFFHLEGDNQMPVVLTPGMSTRFWLNSDELEADTIKAGIGHHKKFRVMAGDALGNEYLSNKVSFKPVK
jgi:hypothetical protein